jgi:hypothetical protein
MYAKKNVMFQKKIEIQISWDWILETNCLVAIPSFEFTVKQTQKKYIKAKLIYLLRQLKTSAEN